MTTRFTSRLLAPVTCLSILLLFLALSSAWYVRNLQQSVSDVMSDHVRSVRAAQELEISIREVRTQFDRYLITQDDGHLKPIPRLKQRTDDALIDAERSAMTDTEQVLMTRARKGHEHFFAEYDRILRERQLWKYTKIIELIDSVLQKEILEPAHEYLNLNETLLAKATETNQKLADRITAGMVGLGLFGSAAGLLGGTVIASTVRRSIQNTEDQVRTTAEKLDEAAHRGSSGGNAPIVRSKDALTQMNRSASAILHRLRTTQRDALRAEQLAWVGQMAAGIAHEIRNPLMSIKILVQATAERADGAFKLQDLQVLEEEIIRLEQIVSGFLDFARPVEVILQQVDVAELIQRTCKGIQARAELQRVSITLNNDLDSNFLSADPNQLRQVVFNLLFNALDAQPEGGTIRIRLSEERMGDQTDVLIAVADGGPGLAESIAERVFEPFVSTKATGMGLGLSICRRMVESHGGTLQATSTTSGATFTVRLPRQVPAHTVQATRSLTWPNC